ncbi:MAG: C1 family peptidase [Acidobacteria bacterium]|nr:C1 family peptidase [Acidobacteriota bacterium]
MAKKSPSPTKRTFDARPDTVDFRDRMFVPTLTEVPPSRSLSVYKGDKAPPILDQGTEGACTGFGLAAVANYLLLTLPDSLDKSDVSPRMFYQMARRYDEWPGEDYDGSSARGAMKGWHKHGVCTEKMWPYALEEASGNLTPSRIADAVSRPLGAYFRVNHKDLVAMHCAITEVGILYATATVHSGWDNVTSKGIIPLEDEQLGGHALAIVAYDQHGFWIQNSWGNGWGAGGFARISYDDWLINGTDVWVARLGVPIEFGTARGIARAQQGRSSKTSAFAFQDLRPHIVTIANDGRLASKGQFANSAQEVASIFSTEFPRITKDWKKKRILLYAHGGLVGQEAAVQRLADYRPAMLEAEIFPLAFVWRTDYWSTITNMLRDALSLRKPEGILDSAKDFMLDRLDDGLEPLARALTGKASWDEMKENALLATTSADGGVRHTLNCLAALAAEAKVEIHIAAHSAGSILHGPAIEHLTAEGDAGLGLKIKTCTLWAPACTTELFKQYYMPAIKAGALSEMAVFLLSDPTERDDHCAHIYHKSLLYLVSNAFEGKTRIPIPFDSDGEPILGMQKFFPKDKRIDLIVSPNGEPMNSRNAARATGHGGFDDDEATLKATLARILGNKTSRQTFEFNSSPSRAKDTRQQLA